MGKSQRKEHIAKKLCLTGCPSVLDIGCGWGGMGLTLARDYGAAVTGITLSREQLSIAQARALAEPALKVHFACRDYRDETHTYDRIVSVGMFEHVGKNNFPVILIPLTACLKMTVWPLSIPSGQQKHHQGLIHLSVNISFPAAIYRNCLKLCQP